LHQPDQRSQSAAIYEFDLVELKHHITVFLDGVPNSSVQREHFISRHDSSMTLHDQNVADRTALQAQLHRVYLSKD